MITVFILQVDKNDTPTHWNPSARGSKEEVDNIRCFREKPLKPIKKEDCKVMNSRQIKIAQCGTTNLQIAHIIELLCHEKA